VGNSAKKGKKSGCENRNGRYFGRTERREEGFPTNVLRRKKKTGHRGGANTDDWKKGVNTAGRGGMIKNFSGRTQTNRLKGD